MPKRSFEFSLGFAERFQNSFDPHSIIGVFHTISYPLDITVSSMIELRPIFSLRVAYGLGELLYFACKGFA